VLVVSVLSGPTAGLTTLRVFVQGNKLPIPDGLLYACTFGIKPSTFPDRYPLLNSATTAFAPDGSERPTLPGSDGSITVSLVGR
jgi:hypothetical protein